MRHLDFSLRSTTKGEFMSLIWKVGGLLATIVVLVAVAIDAYGQQLPATDGYDAIIVAGCRVKPDGTPSLALQHRTNHAVRLYQKGYANKIIFTGGSPDQRPSEAAAASTYAVQNHNIPRTSILLETKSESTEENAQYTAELYPDVRRIILVSDSYHMFRAQKVFERYFEDVNPSGRVPAFNVRIPGTLRELLAIPYYFSKGRL